MRSTVDKLQGQINQVSDEVRQLRERGKWPAQLEPNPENVSAITIYSDTMIECSSRPNKKNTSIITLRNGKELEGPPPISKEQNEDQIEMKIEKETELHEKVPPNSVPPTKAKSAHFPDMLKKPHKTASLCLSLPLSLSFSFFLLSFISPNPSSSSSSSLIPQRRQPPNQNASVSTPPRSSLSSSSPPLPIVFCTDDDLRQSDAQSAPAPEFHTSRRFRRWDSNLRRDSSPVQTSRRLDSAAIPPFGATPSRVAVFARTKMPSISDAAIQPPTASAVVTPPSRVSPAASVVQPVPHSAAQQSRLGGPNSPFFLVLPTRPAKKTTI
ncbi:uncharacterized protein LOC127265992 [Andrographis paniculata]|uniref:uncharacterized protein LOC127265992 n=1 Tax=Andrographis paniculata TaxID=175694 RepID=UPI0021E8552F|nr:uncharacterized protein LOC127265992 [Andrographis paniculata]